MTYLAFEIVVAGEEQSTGNGEPDRGNTTQNRFALVCKVSQYTNSMTDCKQRNRVRLIVVSDIFPQEDSP